MSVVSLTYATTSPSVSSDLKVVIIGCPESIINNKGNTDSPQPLYGSFDFTLQYTLYIYCNIHYSIHCTYIVIYTTVLLQYMYSVYCSVKYYNICTVYTVVYITIYVQCIL